MPLQHVTILAEGRRTDSCVDKEGSDSFLRKKMDVLDDNGNLRLFDNDPIEYRTMLEEKASTAGVADSSPHHRKKM